MQRRRRREHHQGTTAMLLSKRKKGKIIHGSLFTVRSSWGHSSSSALCTTMSCSQAHLKNKRMQLVPPNPGICSLATITPSGLTVSLGVGSVYILNLESPSEGQQQVDKSMYCTVGRPDNLCYVVTNSQYSFMLWAHPYIDNCYTVKKLQALCYYLHYYILPFFLLVHVLFSKA